MATALWRRLITGFLDRLKTNAVDSVDSPNILAIHENSFFVWNSKEQHVLTVTLNTLEAVDNRELSDKSQTLLLTNQPSYDVEVIQLNNCGHFLALSGKHGVSVLELPRRWGGEGKFEGGKEIIMCRSWHIADRFFSCNKKLQVSQVSWHPGCDSHTHLVVLSNDNYIRIYKVTDPTTPTVSIAMGSESQFYYLTSESKMTFSGCLGEVAVSFDFAPPIFSKNVKEKVGPGPKNLIWPLYVLNGNGDVYIVHTCFNQSLRKPSKVYGPLSMHPPADDNYGVDACSLICLQTNPQVLVITTCSGVIYHCIVLNSSDFDSSDLKSIDDSQIGTPADVALYVFERVELSLSLTESKDLSSCPIRLHRDSTTSSRYHCAHSSGLHSVALPFVQYLDKFAISKIMDSNLLTELEGQQSLVEHLICTRPFSSSPNAPVLGLAVASTTLGATLICLLSSWEAVFLPLRTLGHESPFELVSFDPEQEISSMSNANGEGFIDKLIVWLQSSNRTPLLKTSILQGEDPSTQQCVELLANVTQNLREEFLQRLQIAQTQLEKRIKILANQKSQILSDLRSFNHERDSIRNKAESQAERYEELNMKQSQLATRVEKVTKNLQRCIPVLSEEEESMQKELKTIQERLKHLNNSMEQIHSKFEFQQCQIEKDSIARNWKTYQVDVNSNQQKQIRDLLSKEGESIADVVKKVTILKKELGI